MTKVSDELVAYAKEILSDIGFSEIAVYHGRKPDFVKINSL